jgi:hypothetical protein
MIATHEMTLITEHEGTQVWMCPDCGRHLLVSWDPFRRVVLEVGDESVYHMGMEGELESEPE